METTAYDKFMWQKNSRLPLKKRFSPLVSYNADRKENKNDFGFKEWEANPYNKELRIDSYHKLLKMDSYCKELKVEARDVGVNAKLDNYTAASVIINDTGERHTDDSPVVTDLQNAICETIRKWRFTYGGIATVTRATLTRIVETALNTVHAEQMALSKVDDDEDDVTCRTPCVVIHDLTETSSSSDKENIDTYEYDFLSESDTDDEIPTELLQKKMKPGMVPIGDGFAYVPATLLLNMDWSCYTLATRKLLLAVFSRSILATHSLTGKRSPAFPHLPPKKRLPVGMVNDIVQTVVERCGVSLNLVRTAITNKCADESNKYKKKHKKCMTTKRNYSDLHHNHHQ